MIKEETARAQPALRASTCEWRQQDTANGELETKTNADTGEEWAFQYDALGNLLSVALPNGDLVEYLVDGMGRRVGKKKNGVLLTQWIYRDGLKPVAELDGSGALVAEFVYGSKGNVPDYVRRGGNMYRVISDHLGSPRYVVNVTNSADVPFQADYSSFGEVLGTGLDWMPFGFAGGIYDGDSELVRFGARDYDPSLGRWTAKDPIGFDGDGPNLYGYVLADPINRIDESGEGPADCAKAIAKYLDCKGKLDDRINENVCSPNGPDRGHDKAIEQRRNRCEELKRKAFNQCKDPTTWGPLLLGALIGVGIGIATGGGAGAAVAVAL